MDLKDNLEFSTRGQEFDCRSSSSEERKSTTDLDHREDKFKVRATKRNRDYLDDTTSSQDEDEYHESRTSGGSKSHRLSSVIIKPDRRHEVELQLKRKALIESQSKDKQVLDRNKRMFGVLMGTLQKFKKEESGREEQLSKRIKIEEKLEAQVAIDESPTFNNRTRLEYRGHGGLSRTDELLDLAEQKLDATGRFKNWEQTNKHLCNFIRTETEPRIFWSPREHNQTTEKLLKETKDYFNLCIAERAAKYRKEMHDLDNRVKELSGSRRTPDRYSDR